MKTNTSEVRRCTSKQYFEVSTFQVFYDNEPNKWRARVKLMEIYPTSPDYPSILTRAESDKDFDTEEGARTEWPELVVRLKKYYNYEN